jgi:hypothetical protein
MRRIGTSVFACVAAACFCGSASAGIVTVTVSDDGSNSPNSGCGVTSAPSPWQYVVSAGGKVCDFSLRLEAVPGSRASDIVSARVVARLSGVAPGFRFGLVPASGNGIAAAVSVPTGDHTVVTPDATTALKTSSGSVTMMLRSLTGTGQVRVGARSTRKAVLRVVDTSPPRVLGPLASLPPDLRLASAISVGARFTDNGPITTAPSAVLHWGDGALSRLPTTRPTDPFSSAAMMTGTAGHRYRLPGSYRLVLDVTDTAGNLVHRSLGRMHVWGPPTSISPPRVLGAMKVGSTLTCTRGRWLDAGGAAPYTFRWFRDKAMISGAGSAAYTLTVPDRNRRITCRVTARNPVGDVVAAVSPARRLWVAPVRLKRPRVTGHLRVGGRITCNVGTWRWLPNRFRIAWLRNHRQLKSHSRRLRVLRADRGALIQCRVTASNPAGRVTASSKAVRIRR